MQRLQQLERLEQMERLERLDQMERLERLEQMEMTNLSYEDVEINTPIDETIIYLDPPYENTAKYEKCVDHRKLEQYKILKHTLIFWRH